MKILNQLDCTQIIPQHHIYGMQATFYTKPSTSYGTAGKFREIQFSRKASVQSFRGFIFEVVVNSLQFHDSKNTGNNDVIKTKLNFPSLAPVINFNKFSKLRNS